MDNRFTRKYTGKEWAGFIGAKEELSGKAKDVPDEPGVYIFQDDKGEVLYVGKASSLRKDCVHISRGNRLPRQKL